MSLTMMRRAPLLALAVLLVACGSASQQPTASTAARPRPTEPPLTCQQPCVVDKGLVLAVTGVQKVPNSEFADQTFLAVQIAASNHRSTSVDMSGDQFDLGSWVNDTTVGLAPCPSWSTTLKPGASLSGKCVLFNTAQPGASETMTWQDPSGGTARITLPGGAAPPAVGPSAAPPPSQGTQGTSGNCHASGTGEMVLPDPNCTPGGTNPNVTQANIKATICKSGWTDTVRPPESYTEPLKKQDIAAYGSYAGSSLGAYELDHLVPLELGGAPSDPKNFWPEAHGSPNAKDRVEDAANHAVCSGKMPLTTAQQEMASNWVGLAAELGVS